MINDIELAKMSHAVNLRLSYFVTISYANILAESSIRYPVVEYLERRLSYTKLKLEYDHPVFKRKKCDLYVEKNIDRIVFEFKYVRDNTSSLFQDYFDDILRLHYLHAKGIQSLFVVCGDPMNFNNQFRSIKGRTLRLGSRKERPSGVFSQVLSFSTRKPNKRFSTNKYFKNYNDFCLHYDFRNSIEIHPTNITIQTRLISLIHGDSQQSIGIWEVI